MASQKYIEVLRLVVAAQNGIVSDMLKNAEMKYKTIYGLSMFDLRKIAKKFYPDSKLAKELWEKDVREFKILSILIEDPNQIEKEEILNRAEEFNNIELSEQAGGYLFSKLPFAKDLVMPLCHSKNEFAQSAGFILAGKLAQSDNKISNEEFAEFLKFTILYSATASFPLQRSISTALRLIGRKNAKLNEISIEVTKEIAKQNTKSSKWIEEDVLFELQFYKNRFKKKEE